MSSTQLSFAEISWPDPNAINFTREEFAAACQKCVDMDSGAAGHYFELGAVSSMATRLEAHYIKPRDFLGTLVDPAWLDFSPYFLGIILQPGYAMEPIFPTPFLDVLGPMFIAEVATAHIEMTKHHKWSFPAGVRKVLTVLSCLFITKSGYLKTWLPAYTENSDSAGIYRDMLNNDLYPQDPDDIQEPSVHDILHKSAPRSVGIPQETIQAPGIFQILLNSDGKWPDEIMAAIYAHYNLEPGSIGTGYYPSSDPLLVGFPFGVFGVDVDSNIETGAVFTKETATDFVAALSTVEVSSIPKEDLRCPHCWADFDEVSPPHQMLITPSRRLYVVTCLASNVLSNVW